MIGVAMRVLVLMVLIHPAFSFSDAAEARSRAIELRLEANQRDASAQYYLGMMYANSEGVPEDDKAAIKWYRLAADQGLAYIWANITGENRLCISKFK
jgi:TPR repeat protein